MEIIFVWFVIIVMIVGHHHLLEWCYNRPEKKVPLTEIEQYEKDLSDWESILLLLTSVDGLITAIDSDWERYHNNELPTEIKEYLNNVNKTSKEKVLENLSNKPRLVTGKMGEDGKLHDVREITRADSTKKEYITIQEDTTGYKMWESKMSRQLPTEYYTPGTSRQRRSEIINNVYASSGATFTRMEDRMYELKERLENEKKKSNELQHELEVQKYELFKKEVDRINNTAVPSPFLSREAGVVSDMNPEAETIESYRSRIIKSNE